MSERPEPDLDQVRKALREHDERVEEDQQQPLPPDDAPPEEPDDGESS